MLRFGECAGWYRRRRMSPKGRPEGEYRSAQREGSPMNARQHSAKRPSREAGISLVELLVGVLIGLNATAVI